MHDNSLIIMRALLKEFGSHGEGRLAYDVGSQNINGTYRELVEARGWTYRGIDICEGANVDVVVSENSSWTPVPIADTADLVISGQCLEHTKRPWEWIQNVASLMSAGGTLLLIAPSMWPQHRYPVDCWRILPDGMVALAESAGLVCVKAELSRPVQFTTHHEDCFAVMKKPKA
jgi:SAM-dependent methyltransferase